MIVQQLMNPEPYMAAVTTNIRHVLRILSESEVQQVPIVDNDLLVGIVSARDLRQVLSPALEPSKDPNALERVLSRPITSVMSTDVAFVRAEDELGDAIELMLERETFAVPVVATGSRKVVGMVSYVEVLRATRDRF